MSERRSGLAGGCALVLALLAAIVAAALWLWSELSRDDAGAEPATPAPDSRLTRPERRELEAELARVERELEFARGQLHAQAQAETRAAWRARIEELTSQREKLRAELGR